MVPILSHNAATFRKVAGTQAYSYSILLHIIGLLYEMCVTLLIVEMKLEHNWLENRIKSSGNVHRFSQFVQWSALVVTAVEYVL